MKVKSLDEITGKIRAVKFKNSYDLIVGIGNGGIVPAYLLHSYLGVPVDYVWISFRDENHKPKGAVPILERFSPPTLETSAWRGKKILVVDDRSNTGATLGLAKKLLGEAKLVETLVVNGKADYSLFDEECFKMPWEMGGV